MLLRLLSRMFDCCEEQPTPPEPNPTLLFGFLFHDRNTIVKGAITMLQLTDIQKVTTLPLQAVSAKGNPAPIDPASVVWSVSDPTVLNMTDNLDGTVTVAAAGPLGLCQLNVSADADMGDGVRTITGTLDIEVVASAAVAITIQAGVPEDVPPVA
jgi:hypothetical protein